MDRPTNIGQTNWSADKRRLVLDRGEPHWAPTSLLEQTCPAKHRRPPRPCVKWPPDLCQKMGKYFWTSRSLDCTMPMDHPHHFSLVAILTIGRLICNRPNTKTTTTHHPQFNPHLLHPTHPPHWDQTSPLIWEKPDWAMERVRLDHCTHTPEVHGAHQRDGVKEILDHTLTFQS